MRILSDLQARGRRPVSVLPLVLGLAVAIAVFVTVGCTRPSPQELVEERCAECHALSIIEVSHKTRPEWEATVSRMIELSARLNDRQAQEVVDYLSETYGVESP